MKKLFTLLFMWISFFSNAQLAENENIKNNISQLISSHGLNNLPSRHHVLDNNEDSGTRVSGSQFMQEDWTLGVILLPNDDVYEITGRYDIFNDEIQLLNAKKIKAISPLKIKAIALYKHIFVYRSYLEKKEVKQGYFELLHEGNMSLFIRRTTATQKVQTHPVLNNINNDYKVVTQENYFYAPKNKPLMPFKKNKKSVLNILKRKRKLLEKYIRKEKLKVKKQEDLIKIFEFYNLNKKKT